LAKVEADVFLAAYTVRKLIEAKKVSDETEAQKITAQAHPLIKGPVDHWNWHKIDELFDLQRSRVVQMNLLAFCNQVIHSYVFVPVMDEDGLEGFFVASDRERRSQLLYFKLLDVVGALEGVAADDILSNRTELDPAAGERVVVHKSNRPTRTDGFLA